MVELASERERELSRTNDIRRLVLSEATSEGPSNGLVI